MSMWIGISGLGNNLSETEGGPVVPKTNLGSQADQHLEDPSPESHDEKDPIGENWALSVNSRTRRFIIGE